MLGHIVASRVEQALDDRTGGRGRQKVSLEPVARRAAVDQIVQVIAAARRARLKVVNLQFATGLGFVDAAIAAAGAKSVTYRCAAILLIHSLSVSVASRPEARGRMPRAAPPAH